MADFAQYVVSAFESISSNLDAIFDDAAKHSLGDWVSNQKWAVGAAGAGASLLPGAHLAALAADVAFLMNRMYTCVYGIGAVLGNAEGYGNILEEEDFAMVLSLWSGDATLDNNVKDAVIAKSASIGIKVSTKLGAKMGGKMGIKLVGKALSSSLGVLAGKKLAAKPAGKIAAKFAGKLAGKGVSGFIPFLGAAVSGGINVWFIGSVAESAENYYKAKISILSQI